ncbi:MAG: transposase [Actinomycetota bacterium]
MPKILRKYFLFNRDLLKDLARISWETVKDYYTNTCRKEGAKPAAVSVIQTFGDFLSFNPHIHILAADGCFSPDSFFYAPSINIDTDLIEKLFIHRIFKLLLKKGLITEGVVELIASWSHTGFSTYCGKRINPKDKRSTENLARYIIRASFS